MSSGTWFYARMLQTTMSVQLCTQNEILNASLWDHLAWDVLRHQDCGSTVFSNVLNGMQQYASLFRFFRHQNHQILVAWELLLKGCRSLSPCQLLYPTYTSEKLIFGIAGWILNYMTPERINNGIPIKPIEILQSLYQMEFKCSNFLCCFLTQNLGLLSLLGKLRIAGILCRGSSSPEF